MIVKSTVRIPIHYKTTKKKLNILDKLTARLTYAINLINEHVAPETSLGRKTMQAICKNLRVKEKTGLQAGHVVACMEKVRWAWKSYHELKKDWEYKYEKAKERLETARDDETREKLENSLRKLEKREPTPPVFREKTPCFIDIYHDVGKIEKGKNTFSLWMHVSTLVKGETIDIPLNPSHWHLKQLEGAEIKGFEIVKKNGKYYAYVSVEKTVETRKTKSYGGIDQGLNRTIATVLLPPSGDGVPREELLYDEKRKLLDKYDDIIASLQQAMASARRVEPRRLVEYHKVSRKLKQLQNKRGNISVYHDWLLANKVAEYTDGYDIAIGNTRFRQTQYRGNGMPTLRKRIGKWSYGRQRMFIAHKRAERGLPTILIDEKNTSNTCHICGSRLVTRNYHDSSSWILCHSCGAKLDADLNAAYNIALRCRDDGLKVWMNQAENLAST